MIPCPSSLCFVAPVPLSAPVAFVIVLAAFANASPRYRNPGPFHRKLWNGPKWPYLWFLNDSPFTWSGWNGGRRIHVQLNILSAYLFTVYIPIQNWSKLVGLPASQAWPKPSPCVPHAPRVTWLETKLEGHLYPIVCPNRWIAPLPQLPHKISGI